MADPKCDLAGLTAVVVNDDSVQLNLLSGLLRKAGMDVATFESAEAALGDMDPMHPPGLVVTDLYMPGIDGWRFCRLLRSPEYPAFNAVPILVISATFAGEEAVRITADLGANAFLSSPVDGLRFTATVSSLVAGDRPSERLRVLIVEDSKTLVRILLKAMEDHGYRADVALTAAEGMAAIDASVYDAAVIDYHLPDGKGDSLLARLGDSMPDCVCIMMTTDPRPELALTWMKQGASASLRKPFEPEYLIELLARARREKTLLRVEDLLEERTRQMRRTEERWRKLIQHSSDILVILDQNGVERYVSDSVKQTTGFPPETFLDKVCFEFLHPDDRQALMEAFQEILAHPGMSIRREYRHIHKDGGWVYLEAIGTNMLHDADINGIVLHVRDITDRKHAEDAMRESESRLNLAMDVARMGYWRYDCATQDVEWSSGHEALFGIPMDKFGGTLEAVQACVHPEDRDHGIENLRKCIDENIPFENTYRVVHPDGEIRWLYSYGYLYSGGQGQPDHIFGITQDITERKVAEEALRESEERFRMLLDDIPMVSIQGYEPDGTMLYWNRGSTEVYGYTADEALGRNLLDLIIPPEMRDEAAQAIQRMAKTGVPLPPSEMSLKRKDGSRVPVYSSHSVLNRPGHPQELFCVDVDLSQIKQSEAEREKLQAQLNQAQKMESVGRLAGGVAHDFNNMLAVILGQTEMALMKAGPDDPLRLKLMRVQESAQRSAGLVRQLLAFARKQTIARKVLDLNKTVEDILKMLRRLIGEDIEMVWMPGTDLWPVCMDPSQIDQILANLCINAKDAIPGAGKIGIQTRNAALDESACTGHAGFIPGDYVILSVADNGCGMDAETRDRIFEPFFTTKELGKGTGLGLATVYGAVKQNNGFIDVFSEPGQGATFTLYLPRHIGPEKEIQDQEVNRSVHGGNETILLVEDEPMLLEIGAVLLQRLGYRVLTAANPDEAVAIAEKRADNIHLLMTDVILPGMNGRELAERLNAFYPGLKCLFMSGYTSDVIAHHGVLEKGVHFIQKPFSLETLSRKLREVLSGTDAGHVELRDISDRVFRPVNK